MDKASSLPAPSDQLTSVERLMLLLPLISAAVFGLLAFIFTGGFASLLGYSGNDRYIYRLLGAATLGYGVMGIFQLMSRNWREFRWPAVMAVVFNGMAFIASAYSIYRSADNSYADPIGLPVLVGLASLGVAIASLLALQRNGK
jgi:hypothetical protein